MMRKVRFTLAGLMGAVLVAAIGLAALRSPTPAWAGAMFLVTYGWLGVAIIGAVYRRGAPRAWWLGFAVFGCGYIAMAAYSSVKFTFSSLPTVQLLRMLGPALGHPAPQTQADLDMLYLYAQIGHNLWALLLGFLGGTLARFFQALPAGPPEGPGSDAPEPVDRPRGRWGRPALIAWVGLMLAGSAGVIRAGSDARIWAGAVFFLTWSLLGLAGLVAIFGRGRRRQAAVGASLLGVGYLLLAFARAPYQLHPAGPVVAVRSLYQPLPTTSLLNGVRRWIPALARGQGVDNARIVESLERPVAMSFPDPTPLRDVLRYVTTATSTPGYRGIPIYVDPIGLQEAERTMDSTVQIDLSGIPLKTSLQLGLDQLGLAYEVKDGILRITAHEDLPSEPDDLAMVNATVRWVDSRFLETMSDLDEPFLTVGHCLLALLSAGFGAVAAPLVAETGRPRTGRAGSPTSSTPPVDQAGRSAGAKSGEND